MLDTVDRLYFAYGSNMSSARLLARVPGCAVHGAARLVDWRLAFDKPSRDGSAKANVAPLIGHLVWGVVWSLPESGWSRLDGFEPGYERVPCDVFTRSDDRVGVQLYTYRGAPGGHPPFDWYLAHLTDGAEEHGLPDAWVARLKAWPTRAPASERGSSTGR